MLEIIEERTDGVTAEELTAFWDSGGGADPGMLTGIDALFTDEDSFSGGDSR